MQKKLFLILLVSVAQINALSKPAVVALSAILGFVASYSGPNAISLIFDKAREINDPELKKQWIESLRDISEKNRKSSLRRAERYESLFKKMESALENISLEKVDKVAEIQETKPQSESLDNVVNIPEN